MVPFCYPSKARPEENNCTCPKLSITFQLKDTVKINVSLHLEADNTSKLVVMTPSCRYVLNALKPNDSLLIFQHLINVATKIITYIEMFHFCVCEAWKSNFI